MGLILLAMVGAVLVGWACGGRPARLAGAPVRGWRLLVICLAVLMVQALVVAVGAVEASTTPRWLAVLFAGVLAALFCVLNRGVPGLGLAGLGLGLNLLVIGLNGAMPVSVHALARAGATLPGALGVTHTVADQQTVLRPLGEVVPVPLPGRPEVDSVGNLLLAAGAAQFLLTGVLGAHRTIRFPRPTTPVWNRPGMVPQLRRGTWPSARSTASASSRYRRTAEPDSELVRVISDLPADDSPDRTRTDQI